MISRSTESNTCCFQLFKYGNLTLFFVLYNSKQNIFAFCTKKVERNSDFHNFLTVYRQNNESINRGSSSQNIWSFSPKMSTNKPKDIQCIIIWDKENQQTLKVDWDDLTDDQDSCDYYSVDWLSCSLSGCGLLTLNALLSKVLCMNWMHSLSVCGGMFRHFVQNMLCSVFSTVSRSTCSWRFLCASACWLLISSVSSTSLCLSRALPSWRSYVSSCTRLPTPPSDTRQRKLWWSSPTAPTVSANVSYCWREAVWVESQSEKHHKYSVFNI